MSADSSRILIVDDDEAMRYVRSRVLRGRGYSVSEARLGRDALVLAATEKPDLTLLDVKLPDLSGIEVCREIKSRFPDMIVLQTSAAFTGVADRTNALDGGADSYLIEPIEPDELVATVNALLRMRRAEQEARGSTVISNSWWPSERASSPRPTGASPTRSPIAARRRPRSGILRSSI